MNSLRNVYVTWLEHTVKCTVVISTQSSTRNLKVKWQQQDSNPETLRLSTNTQTFGQTGQMIQLFWVLICRVHLTACSCHVTYAFQSDFALYKWLNVKELLAWSRRKIWCLSDWNWIGTQNNFVRKRTINHLVKLAKWFSCVLSTYLYGAFDCVLVMSRMRFRVNPHSIVACS